MPYCLGLHIDNNFIKYAKVLNEKDKEPKVESYGVVCYENLNMAIENILKETSSYGNVEIATNVKGEFYNYFEVFSGLPPMSLKKNLELEFQNTVCSKMHITPTSVISKYILSAKKYDEDTDEAIYITANKTDINESKKIVKGKVKKILPTSLANLSLVNMEENSNFAILNIDAVSNLTIVLQGKVKKIVSINIGMSNILTKLNQKYNSYAKSYEKCKSITLYNENTRELEIESDNAEDVDNVVPMLYDIAQRVISTLDEFKGMINKLYITGDAVVINNIDLYFEGLLEDVHCDVLKPSFIISNPNISNKIKDYAEVNSAIALAISNGKVGNLSINFASDSQVSEKIGEIKENKVVSKISGVVEKSKNVLGNKEKTSAKVHIENSTLILQTILWTIVLATYIGASYMVRKQYEDNTKDLKNEIVAITEKTEEVKNDTKAVTTAKLEYDRLIEKIETLNAELLEINGVSYDIPRLMDNIAMLIPDKVTVTRITVDSSNMVKISAECEDSAELGFFVSRLKNEEVMKNIRTSIESEEASLKKITIIGAIL